MLQSDVETKLQILQSVLSKSNRHSELESLAILTTPEYVYQDVPPALPPLSYPNLKRMTLTFTTRAISDFRVKAPCLQSLHIIYNEIAEVTRLEHLPGIYFPEGVCKLREFAISTSGDTRMDTVTLFRFLGALTKCNPVLPLLTIRDIALNSCPDDEVPDFSSEVRFEHLKFDNVTHGRISSSRVQEGSDDPRELDYGWTALSMLLRRAARTDIIQRSGMMLENVQIEDERLRGTRTLPAVT